MWKDDAIDTNIVKIGQFLVNNISDKYKEIIFVAELDAGAVGISAIYYDESGRRRGIEGFFDIAGDLEVEAKSFHDIFVKNGENFKCFKLKIDIDDNFSLDFDYDNPHKWDLSDNRIFPKNK